MAGRRHKLSTGRAFALAQVRLIALSKGFLIKGTCAFCNAI